MSNPPAQDKVAGHTSPPTIRMTTLVVLIALAVAFTSVITAWLLASMITGQPAGDRREPAEELLAQLLLGKQGGTGGPATLSIPASLGVMPSLLKAVFLVLVFGILVFKFDRVHRPDHLRLAGLLLALSIALPTMLLFTGSLIGIVGVRFLLFIVMVDLGLLASSVYLGILSLVPQFPVGLSLRETSFSPVKGNWSSGPPGGDEAG